MVITPLRFYAFITLYYAFKVIICFWIIICRFCDNNIGSSHSSHKAYNMHIFNHSRVNRLFHFGCDFPISGEICGVFGQNDPPKVQIWKKTCWEGTFLRQTASLERSCVEIDTRVWAVRVARKDKTQKNKRHSNRIFHHHVEGPAETISTELGGVVDQRDIIALAKYDTKLFVIVTLVSGWSLPF